MTKPDPQRDDPELSVLSDHIEESLLRHYGPILGGVDLPRALGFPSRGAFQQAVQRQVIEISVFGIPKRRGTFALAKDVARWLATQRLNPISARKSRARRLEGAIPSQTEEGRMT